MPNDIKLIDHRRTVGGITNTSLWTLSGLVLAACSVPGGGGRGIRSVEDGSAFTLSSRNALTYEDGMLALAAGQTITVPGAMPGDAPQTIAIPERTAAPLTTAPTPLAPQLVYVDNTGASPALMTGTRAEFAAGGTTGKYIIGVIGIGYDRAARMQVTELHPVQSGGMLADLLHSIDIEIDPFAGVEEGGSIAGRTYDQNSETNDAPRLRVNDVNTGQTYTYEFSLDGENWQAATGAPRTGLDRFGGTFRGQYGTLTLTDDPAHNGGIWSYMIDDAENPELANLYTGDYGVEFIYVRVHADGGAGGHRTSFIDIGIDGLSDNVPFNIALDADGDNRNDARNIAPGMAGNEGFIVHSGGEVSWVVNGGMLVATFKGGSFTRNNGERADFAESVFTFDSYGRYLIVLEESTQTPGVWGLRYVDALNISTLADEHYRLGTLVVNAETMTPQTITADEHTVFHPNYVAQQPYEADIAGVKLTSALADHMYSHWDIAIDKSVADEGARNDRGYFSWDVGTAFRDGEFTNLSRLEIRFHHEDDRFSPDINDTPAEIVRKFLLWEDASVELFDEEGDYRFQEVRTRFAAEDTSGGSNTAWLTMLEAAYPGLAGADGSVTITDPFSLTDGRNPDVPNSPPVITVTDTSDNALTANTITIDDMSDTAAFKITFTDADSTDIHAWRLLGDLQNFRVGPYSDMNAVSGSDAAFFIAAVDGDSAHVARFVPGTTTKIKTGGAQYGEQAAGTITELGSLVVTGTGNTRTITFTPNAAALDLVAGGSEELLAFAISIADFDQGTTDITPGTFAMPNSGQKSASYISIGIRIAPPVIDDGFMADDALTPIIPDM